MEFQGVVDRTFALANLMVTAARLHLFVTIMAVGPERRVLGFKKGWAGGDPDNGSRAYLIGPSKAAELLIDGLEADFLMTPVPHPLSTGWKGGVRRLAMDAHLITSASGWSERCDAQLALALNYAMEYEVRLHHVGFRHPTMEAMLAAVAADERRLGVKARNIPAEDHERRYVPFETSLAPNGVYWIEHQYFPTGKHTPATHWDLATSDALGLLDFIAGHLETPTNTWRAGLNDPVGVTWQTNKEEGEQGVMTRPRWWQIS